MIIDSECEACLITDSENRSAGLSLSLGLSLPVLLQFNDYVACAGIIIPFLLRVYNVNIMLLLRT